MNWYKRQLKTSADKRTWTEEELDRIKKLLEKGYSYTDIAEMFHVSRPAISYLNKKYKMVDRSPFFDKKLKEDEFISSLYLLPPYGEGMSAKDIREQYGFTAKKVMSALKRLGKIDEWRDRKDMWNDELRDHQRQNMLRRFEEGYGEELSPKLQDYWDRIGRLGGFLTSYPTREQAIAWLENFKARNYIENPQKTMATYNKYMRIINNHTFPDEIQRQQDQSSVTASKNWYKKAKFNGIKVKYGPRGNFYILGRNYKTGEGEWRISYFDAKGRPVHHDHFPTYEEAENFLNGIEGSEEMPEETDNPAILYEKSHMANPQLAY